jgi:hypothetical protein
MPNVSSINHDIDRRQQQPGHPEADASRGLAGAADMVLWRRIIDVLTAIGDAAMGPHPPQTTRNDRVLARADRRVAMRLHRAERRRTRAQRLAERAGD